MDPGEDSLPKMVSPVLFLSIEDGYEIQISLFRIGDNKGIVLELLIEDKLQRGVCCLMGTAKTRYNCSWSQSAFRSQ